MKKKTQLNLFLKLFGCAATLLLTASACQHGTPVTSVRTPGPPAARATSPVTKALSFPKLPTPFPGIMQITQLGDNSQAHFSFDGTRILFISRLRTNHKQAQVYEMTIPQMVERRLTFHDGDDLDPAYSPNGSHFYYSSATDEIKEESVATEKLMRNYYPEGLAKISPNSKSPSQPSELLSEIYYQALSGREIERLTETAGFDAEVDVEPKNDRHVVFTSMRDGLPGVYLADTRARGARRITEGKNIERSPRFSPDAKSVAWTRTQANSPSMQLLVAEGNLRKPREVLNLTGLILHPAWHPSGTHLFFSSNWNGKFFNLYIIDREGQCLKRVSTLEFDETQPAVSPDGSRVFFTGRRGSENSQIYSLDLPASLLRNENCLAVPSTSTPAPTAAPSPAPAPVPSATPTPAPAVSPEPSATPAA